MNHKDIHGIKTERFTLLDLKGWTVGIGVFAPNSEVGAPPLLENPGSATENFYDVF